VTTWGWSIKSSRKRERKVRVLKQPSVSKKKNMGGGNDDLVYLKGKGPKGFASGRKKEVEGSPRVAQGISF